MPSKWIWIIILDLIFYAVAVLEDENTRAFIQLTELDYEDTCSVTAEAEWEFINSPSNGTLLLWEDRLLSYARFKNLQREEIRNNTEYTITDPSLKYKYNVAEKIGDALLGDEHLKTLVHFAGESELLRLSRIRKEPLYSHTRKDVEQILSRGNDVENKSSVWNLWHEELTPDSLVKNFSTILLLVDAAAKANDAQNVEEYWELLSAYTDGYDLIKSEWNRIVGLHRKILKYVITVLSQKYKISMNDTISAYLLGSLQGSDWTPISVDTTPYPDIMFNINKNLWKQKLLGRSMYKTASAMSSQILSQAPQAGFWKESHFHGQCPSRLINFCRNAVLRVSTCFEPSISNFLTAHKNVGKIVFNQLSAENTPVLNTANRYSPLEEAVSELFGILAASPVWLNYTRIIDNSTDNEQRLITSQMITALNTLPRIAYYMSADMWRINAIRKEITNPDDLVSTWWEYRAEYEGLDSNGTKPPTFLNDEYITSNKPYLPKLAGTILAFQLYEYLMGSTEVRYDSIIVRPMNVDFLKMIQQGSAYDWMKVTEKYLEIDEISTSSLISFFSPLEDFIDELLEDFEYKPVTAKESELDELAERIIAEANAPPTTTTTTTTTPRTLVTRTKNNKQNDGRSDTNIVDNSRKNTTWKSSGAESKMNSLENHNVLVSTTTEAEAVPFDGPLMDDNLDDNEKPKINTSKAVWAVGAVLLATIIICIIAIFGRQRCRKTPKNRRYV